MMTVFLDFMVSMSSRVSRNRICMAALMSKMSAASRYSLALSRSALADIILLYTSLLVLETLLKF